MTDTRPGSHASVDRAQRTRKAEKIIRILEDVRPLRGLRVLEIGTGSGVIANAIARTLGPGGELSSVDVRDQRIVSDGYTFIPVVDARLPFPDESFDAVVSNHVIEHVGSEPEQLRHLREIHRVLRADGIGYLATPNRWAIVEPHYRLPFLSWVPQAMADAYVRAAGKASTYDCAPLGPSSVRALMESAGLRSRSRAGRAARLVAELEGGAMGTQVARLLPMGAIDLVSGMLPTLVFLMRK